MLKFLLFLTILYPLVIAQRLLYEPSAIDYKSNSEGQSLFDKLAPDPSLSTFMDALTQVEDIFNLLNHTDTDNNQVYTVFCPVNSAFKKELDVYTRSHLEAFLRNHIVPNVKLDPNSLNKAHSLDTLLPGQSISVKYHFFSKRTVLNKNANVDINHPVEAINGIAYKIDHLLRPT